VKAHARGNARSLIILGISPTPSTPGLFSFASTNESLFGVFEFAPVIIAVGLWAVWPIELEMKRMNEMGEEEKV
jgi:hypothetical protein